MAARSSKLLAPGNDNVCRCPSRPLHDRLAWIAVRAAVRLAYLGFVACRPLTQHSHRVRLRQEHPSVTVWIFGALRLRTSLFGRFVA